MKNEKLYEAVESAVAKAMAEVGISQFKRMSFFMSNETRQVEIKRAA